MTTMGAVPAWVAAERVLDAADPKPPSLKNWQWAQWAQCQRGRRLSVCKTQQTPNSPSLEN